MNVFDKPVDLKITLRAGFKKILEQEARNKGVSLNDYIVTMVEKARKPTPRQIGTFKALGFPGGDMSEVLWCKGNDVSHEDLIEKCGLTEIWQPRGGNFVRLTLKVIPVSIERHFTIDDSPVWLKERHKDRWERKMISFSREIYY